MVFVDLSRNPHGRTAAVIQLLLLPAKGFGAKLPRYVRKQLELLTLGQRYDYEDLPRLGYHHRCCQRYDLDARCNRDTT